jgi:hypothetical protein
MRGSDNGEVENTCGLRDVQAIDEQVNYIGIARID